MKAVPMSLVAGFPARLWHYFSALLVLAAGLACVVGSPRVHAASASDDTADKRANPATPAIPLVATPNYRAIVDRYGPAVVGVAIDSLAASPRRENNRGDAQLPGPGEGTPDNAQKPSFGLGSGFIISADGLILTNAHVVQGASHVTVTLDDRREFAAKVLGLDAETDIAVLKVDASQLPIVRLGDSNQLRVGDYVLAIGTPFGLEQTATSGIVSAMRRPLPDQPYVPFIQTDAAVNPGNSGGPLFNARGEVVGINAEIYSTTGSFAGVSFSIPINLAKEVADQIVASGHFEHGRLGITVQQLTQPLARAFGLKHPDGALVSAVAPHSMAAAAGLHSGDIILQCNGQPIRRAVDISAIFGAAKPNDTISFSTWRDGQERAVSVTLSAEHAGTTASDADVLTNERTGLAVKLLTADEQKLANVSHGLIVITASGPAQLSSAAAAATETLAILVERGGTRNYVALEIY